MQRMVMILFLILAVILGTGCGEPSASAMTFTSRPNVILISIDALRADHLGCYGYERATSPVLDRLAATGTRFANCQSQAPWTLPSHASIFTGMSVVSHGAGFSYGRLTGIDESLPTLPEVLSESGFNTSGIVNISFLSPSSGFDRGFDRYACLSHYDILNARETLTGAVDYLHLRYGARSPSSFSFTSGTFIPPIRHTLPSIPFSPTVSFRTTDTGSWARTAESSSVSGRCSWVSMTVRLPARISGSERSSAGCGSSASLTTP
jgi:hypothetical protein